MTPEYINFVLSLLAVLALLYAVLWCVKKFGLAQVSVKSQGKRLKLIEVLPIDAKKRIVLFQKDDLEYTIFVGESDEFVIEEGPAKTMAQKNSVTQKKTVKSKSHDSKNK